MKNVSVSNLFLQSLVSSPYFSNVPSLSISSSRISKSFHHFVYNSNNLKIKSSYFKSFQNSVVMYEQNRYKITGTKRKPLPIPGYGQDIIVDKATFIDCVSDHDGGAINHFSPDEGNLKVKDSTFSRCIARSYPADGGAIYFSGNSSRFDRVCGIECQATREGHFICIVVRGKESHINQLNRTVIFKCSNLTSSTGWQTCSINNGEIFISSLNITQCQSYLQCSAIKMQSEFCLSTIQYSTIQNSNGPWTISFSGNPLSLIKYTNILNNTATNTNFGIVQFENGKIEDCAFFGNIGKILFKKYEDSILIITKCFCDATIPKLEGVEEKDNKGDLEIITTFTYSAYYPRDCQGEYEYRKYTPTPTPRKTLIARTLRPKRIKTPHISEYI